MSEVSEIKTCLENKRVLVKFKANEKYKKLPKNHILWAGKLDNTTDKFQVKAKPNGSLYDVFTKNEAAFVANEMGLDPRVFGANYRGDDGFWDDYKVNLSKEGLILDLSNLEDFIKYKVLLTNDGLIAPNLKSLKDRPKASYKYYIVDEGAEKDASAQSMTNKMRAYKELGKISGNIDKLRYITKSLTDKYPGTKVKSKDLEAILDGVFDKKIDKFFKVIEDEYFPYKVLIENAYMYGVVTRDRDLYFHEGKAIANEGVKSTLHNAAIYLADPINQQIKFLIEERIKTAKE